MKQHYFKEKLPYYDPSKNAKDFFAFEEVDFIKKEIIITT